MKNENIVVIQDLIHDDWEQLELDQAEIQKILENAKPENSVNPYFVGTDVYKWLTSFEACNDEWYEENQETTFEILYHDNTYNWNGHSNVDIDFKTLVDNNDNLYALVKIHIGSDIRAGYTKSILLDLNSYCYGMHDKGLETFLEFINEYESDYGYVTINEKDYSVVADIFTSEDIYIYDHESGESYYGLYGGFYNSESEEALNSEIIEALKEYFTENNIEF